MPEEQNSNTEQTPAPPPMQDPAATIPPAVPQPTPYGLQLLIGFVAAGLLPFGIATLIGGVGLLVNQNWTGIPVFLISLVFNGIFLWLFFWRRKRGPGFIAGLLIAIGLMALAAGICAAMLTA